MLRRRKILMNFIPLALLICFSLIKCTHLSKPSFQKAQKTKEVSVMAYNMENLFDTLHDNNRTDYTYQPLTAKQTKKHQKFCKSLSYSKYIEDCLHLDWSKDTLNRKMSRLATVILQVNDGHGPDILIVEEVENKNVLSQLNEKFLKKASYKTLVLLEGPSKRGIDIGLLSRLPLARAAQLHQIPFRSENSEEKLWMSRSRAILQVDLKLPNNEILTVFGVHFPSPSNPTHWRVQALEFLAQLKASLPKDRLSIVGGDFNISSEEEQNHQLYSKILQKDWLVSHEVGCEDCRGTNYYHYKRSWSFLDALLFDKKMASPNSQKWALDPKSIAIPKSSPYQVNRYLSPARFNPSNPVGVSDHWPIYARIYIAP